MQASSLNGASSSNGGSSAVASQPGLLLPCGGRGAWDEAGVGHAVVRYFLGDDEQRWFMWYTGRSEACQSMDDVFPSSGSIGERWCWFAAGRVGGWVGAIGGVAMAAACMMGLMPARYAPSCGRR